MNDLKNSFDNLFDGYLHYIRECELSFNGSTDVTIPYPYYNARLMIMVTGHILFAETCGISIIIMSSGSSDPDGQYYRPLKIVKVCGSDYYMNKIAITPTSHNTFNININNNDQYKPMRGIIYSLCQSN